MLKKKASFTLIEVVLVVALISALATITIVAVNPTKQIEEALDTQRRSDINAILNAVYQYAIDNGGIFPAAIDNTNRTIADFDADICTELVPTYLTELPIDPTPSIATYFNDCTDYLTEYQITVDAASFRITVTAPNSTDNISITK